MIILPSLEIVPAKYNTSTNTLLSQIPIDGTGDFTVTRATSPTTGRSTRVNALGQIELVADNVPRLDYLQPDGTIGCPALLVEPGATNSIRNNSMVGASVSGNTSPTNYSISLAGLTRTIVGTGTENGVVYMDIRFNGTSTGGAVVIQEETSTSIAAAQGQVWTHSVYAKLIANVLNMPSARVGMYEYTSGGVYLTEGSNPFTLTSSLNRFSFTRTLANASTARVTPIVQWLVNNGVSYDFTVRIGYPQMELGSVATSVIPTTTQAITRSNEIMTRTSASGLIGQSEGAIYWDIAAVGSVPTGTGNPELNIRNEAFTNWIGLTSNSSPNPFRITVQAVAGNLINYQASITSGKAAVAWSSAGAVLYVNGVQVATSATNPNFSFSRAEIRGSTMAFKANAFALYPTRLTDTQLALLTSPYTSYSSMASALSYTLG